MTRVTRVPRNAPVTKPQPEPSSLRNIPVTPITLFFGFVGLSVLAGLVNDGYRSVSNRMHPAEIEQCLSIRISQPNRTMPLPATEWNEASDQLPYHRAVAGREKAEAAAASCWPATCEGAELADYFVKVTNYVDGRVDRMASTAPWFGQPGIDRLVEFHNTFADRRIENSIRDMAAAGKMPPMPSGNSQLRQTAAALATLIKYGPESLVPCGSEQDKVRVAAQSAQSAQ